jgi:hypothetical protein
MRLGLCMARFLIGGLEAVTRLPPPEEIGPQVTAGPDHSEERKIAADAILAEYRSAHEVAVSAEALQERLIATYLTVLVGVAGWIAGSYLSGSGDEERMYSFVEPYTLPGCMLIAVSLLNGFFLMWWAKQEFYICAAADYIETYVRPRLARLIHYDPADLICWNTKVVAAEQPWRMRADQARKIVLLVVMIAVSGGCLLAQVRVPCERWPADLDSWLGMAVRLSYWLALVIVAVAMFLSVCTFVVWGQAINRWGRSPPPDA